MNELEGKYILVAGGTGSVGEGLVLSFMRAGATVIVPIRNTEKAANLQSYVAGIGSGELLFVEGTLDTEENALKLRDDVHRVAPNLDLAVASLGGWWQGLPLTSIRIDTWNTIVADNLTSHFLAVRAFVPLLNPKSGIYVHINGFSAEQPYPMAAPVAMMAAAQKMMVLTLSEELKPTNLKVYELILGPIKTRQRLQHSKGRENWYYPEEIGDYIIKILQNPPKEVVHRLLEKKMERPSD
ncbi:MAG: SDR family NAD(P)-dependent oxidoreductase [Saprospiraceae bacterium]